MTCRLCLKDVELRNSHILPEFFYKPLYDEKGRLLGLHGQGSKRREYVQKGIREKLLCAQCETYINDLCEKYFHKYWFHNSALPLHLPEGRQCSLSFEFGKFKLLLLSVLWRCSVSTHETYKFVKLGPHEEIIRKILRDGVLPEKDRYPILFHALIHDSGEINNQLISMPLMYKMEGHAIYEMIFGGCAWYFKISNHSYSEFESLSFVEGLPYSVTSMNYKEMGVVGFMSKVIRGEASVP